MWGDAWISHGRRNRINFVGELKVDWDKSGRLQMGEDGIERVFGEMVGITMCWGSCCEIQLQGNFLKSMKVILVRIVGNDA